MSLRAVAHGVTSINGENGAVTLTSTGGTITITPSGQTINLESAGGGGGTPGGTNGQIQYNNSGAFAGIPASSAANANWDINLNKTVTPISSASPNFDGFFEAGGADTGVPAGTVWEAEIYSYIVLGGTTYYSPTPLSSGAPYTTTMGQILGFTWDADPNADGYLVYNNIDSSGFIYSIDVGNSLSYDTQTYGWPGNSAVDPPTPTQISTATYLNYLNAGVIYGLYTSAPIVSTFGMSSLANLSLGTPLTPANGGLGTTNSTLNDLSGNQSVDANNRILVGSGGINNAIEWSSGSAILNSNIGLPGPSIDAGQQFLYYSSGHGSPVFLDYGNGLFYDTGGNLVLSFGSKTANVNSINYAASAPFTVNGQLWNDTVQHTFSVYLTNVRENISTVLFTQTANSGPSNTGTETTLIGTGAGTQTLPNNFWIIGKTIRIKGGGVFTTPVAPGNLVIKVKYGSVVIATATVSTLAISTTNGGFEYDLSVTCRSTGTTGTVMTVGKADFDLTANTQGTANLNNAGSVATINTTTSNALDVTATWSTSTTSTITGTVGTIEVLN